MQEMSFKIEHLLPYLKENIDTDRIHIYQCLQSTNDTAKELAKNKCPHGTVVIASAQTAGRGRFNRSFFSPDSTGLYISFVLDKDKLGLRESTLLTPMTAVITSKVIHNVTSKKCGIKWVNDLYLEDKKVCGILTEGVLDGQELSRFVVGIGINIGTKEFPPELENVAGALFMNAESECLEVRNHMAAELINELTKENVFDNTEKLMSEYKESQIIMGKIVDVINVNEIYEARVLEIDDLGCLVVERTDGMDANRIEKLISGEVSIRRR